MTVDEIVQRVRERSRRLASGLPVPQPPLGGDFSLNGVVPVPETFRPAAVLVPLVRREPGITVLLTQRTDDIPNHTRLLPFPLVHPPPSSPDPVPTPRPHTSTG